MSRTVQKVLAQLRDAMHGYRPNGDDDREAARERMVRAADEALEADQEQEGDQLRR